MSVLKTTWSIAKLQCPVCQTAPMYKNPSLWNLRQIGDMPDNCTNCGQDFVIETGFYFGAMFVSYFFTVCVLFLALGISLVLYGTISRTFLYLTFAVSLLFWTYLFRISRVIWLAAALAIFPNYRTDEKK